MARGGSSDAERRQLTVLFCDLVGSTALSVELDPEELRDVLRAYQDTCGEVVDRFEGHIARYLGDGLLVYFGYPRAHEDDAHRAIHAALGIVEAIGRLNERLRQERGLTLALRLGIYTGLVVAGELGARQQPDPLAIVGDAPNIAARLQEMAEPDTVVIGPATYRLVRGYFSCRSLGRHLLKGLPAPIEVYRVLASSEDQNQVGPPAAVGGVSPMIGREAELELLLDRWQRARSGQGQIVLVRGEAGIGKSRLARALQEHLDAESHATLQFRCSAYHQDSALHPVIASLQRTIGLSPGDTPAEALARLEASAAGSGLPMAEAVVLFARLLSLPLDDRYPPLDLTPQRQRQKTLEALLAWLLTIARREPTLVIIEDLHWVDPSTLELITMLVEHEQSVPVLTLLTFRPEFVPRWPARDNLTTIDLRSLDAEQTVTLATAVAGDKRLPAEVLDEVAARTDGVPLFVEELTKMVLESGLLREAGQRYALAGALQSQAIPTTVQDSLTARLDRLSTAKPVAQLGAALGREFRYEVLRAVSSLDDSALQRELGHLMDAELLYEGKPPPDATYLFKHVLVQDAAYQSLLRSTRQRYHQQIAQVLADRFPETAETEPEVLAHHLSLAGDVEEAVTYWLRAGRRAVDRSAYVEAIRHLRHGLDLLRGLPETLERAQQELPLQATLGLPLLMTRGYAADEVEQAFARARALCDQIGETPQMYPVLWGLWAFYVVRTNFQASTDAGDQLLHLGLRQADVGLQLEAHAAHGLNYFWQGDLATARDHFEKAIGYYDPVEHWSHADQYGQDAAVISYSHLSLLLWIQGYPDQALARHRQGLELARARAHAFSLGLALAFAAICHHLRRDPPVARTFAEQCIAITSEHGFALWLADGEIIRGWALAHLGNGAAGLAQLRHGVAGFAAVGALLWVTHQHGLVAEVCGLLGQVDDALAEVEQGLAIANRSGERYFEAELHRLTGELLLQRTVPDEAEAEAAFLRALERARLQGAKSFELRAAMSLYRLRQRQGRDEGALALLRDVYAWFTEGFDTADLREAQVLLAAAGSDVLLSEHGQREATDTP